MKNLLILLILIVVSTTLKSQSIKFEKAALSDTVSLAMDMQNLAKAYLRQSQIKSQTIDPNDFYLIEILAGKYARAIKTIQASREAVSVQNGHPDKLPYELFAEAKKEQSEKQSSFETAYRKVLSDYLQNCSDQQLASVNIVLTTYDQVAQFTNQFKENYEKAPEPKITQEEAITLLQSYFLYQVFHLTEPIVFMEVSSEQNRRYHIEQKLIVSPIDNAEIDVTVVRKRETGPLPAILTFTIYADSSNINQAILPASKGYVGVLAYSRGKGLSNDAIEPYKHEHNDVYAVIDWISKQPWNNGKVGMFGGSYNGFAQWASMKDSVHPALKTIVPCVSAAPGIDVPMENNIFYNFSYKWISYVTENKYLYNTDYQRWNNLQNTWFKSGTPYNKMDSIDGTPNQLFHEWISHPSYDSYWQSMIPYKDEFAHIDIPILSITGYYDDGQRSAMYYYNQHLKYNPDAAHYLLIGPWDHWGAQSTPGANLRGYQLDEVAQIDIQNQLIFDWFDYILKGKEKPEILKDKVNFQVMGTNQWMHKPSVSAMSNKSDTFYLGRHKSNGHYSLISEKPKKETIKLEVDLVNRTTINNADYYPWPIIKDSINLDEGLVFISDPFQKGKIINGSFSCKLNITANKKDFDFSVNLYELTHEGMYFHLSYYIGRVSYSKSREVRELLKPNKETTITFNNTRIISKKISKGSRLIIIVNGNKNPYSQINYGTDKDVSTESNEDANEPLLLKIGTNSKINIPLWNEE
ncbi:MAG: CocE/NonD family hydrolase [Bacteroidales bacterium]|nr:CocE/NonD family hydrolase [Bacteroidales bacterium]